MKRMDLSCDLGERPEAILDGTDEALMACISSASIACGGHAGDSVTMEETFRSALRHGVAVGAHPGYPDRERFGRVALAKTAAEIEDLVFEQVASLGRIANCLGATLAHVKPHGALYHAAVKDPAIAQAIGRGIARFRRELVLVGLAGSRTLDVWAGMGFRVAAEAFADRRYEPDGTLRSRIHADALITEATEAAVQALRIADGEGVTARDGTCVAVRADTICIHSDTPGSPTIAREIRTRLEAAGFRLEPPFSPWKSGGDHP